MNVEMKINYNWECDQGIDIPKAHEEDLKKHANERIFYMLKEGYYSGELCTSVRYGKDVVPEEEEEDGLTYSGWWSVSYK